MEIDDVLIAPEAQVAKNLAKMGWTGHRSHGWAGGLGMKPHDRLHTLGPRVGKRTALPAWGR